MAKTSEDSIMGKRCSDPEWGEKNRNPGADHGSHGVAGRIHPGGVLCEGLTGIG